MATNPDPARITPQLWWLWEQFRTHVGKDLRYGGIYANKSGYHNTRTANARYWPGNYSIQYAADKRGPADKAAGIDLTFTSAQRGDYSNIAKYSRRLMAAKSQLRPYLREFYGQTDADRAVEGYDYQRRAYVTSDSSHLWHIHISFLRDAVDSWEAVRAVLAVLKGQGVPVPGPKPVPSPASKLGTRVLSLKTPYMTGADVKFVQKWIGRVAVDGVFGPKTKARVVWYQRMRGIAVDGVVGPKTWAQMGVKWRG